MRISSSIIIVGVLLLGVLILSAEPKSKKITPSSKYITTSISNVTDFQKIDMGSLVNVNYSVKKGPAKVEVYCPDNLVDILDIYVANATLYATMKKGYTIKSSGLRNFKILVTCSSESLNDIKMSGVGNFNTDSPLSATDFKLNCSGVSNFKAASIKADRLDYKSSGTGNGTINSLDCKQGILSYSGTGNLNVGSIKSDNFKATTSGTSNITANSLTSNIIALESRGTGNVTINSIDGEELSATCAGTSNITLSGKVSSATLSTSGTGNIRAAQLIANEVEAQASGVGNIDCHATQKIIAKRTGIGNINYYGNPSTTQVEAKGINRR